MGNYIFEDDVIVIRQIKDCIFILAINQEGKIVLLKIDRNIISKIGEINIANELIKKIEFMSNQQGLAILSNNSQLYFCRISEKNLETILISENIEGESIKFSEDNLFLINFNFSEICVLFFIDKLKFEKIELMKSNQLDIIESISSTGNYYNFQDDYFDLFVLKFRLKVKINEINPIDKLLMRKYFKKKVNISSKNKKTICNTTKNRVLDNEEYCIKKIDNNGKILIGIAKRDSKMDIWEKRGAKFDFSYSLDKHIGFIKTLIFNSNCNLLVSASSTNEIKIWKKIDGRFCIFQTLKGHTSHIISIQITNNDEFIITQDLFKTIIIWAFKQEKIKIKKKKKLVKRFSLLSLKKKFPFIDSEIKISKCRKYLQISQLFKEIPFFDIKCRCFIKIEEENVKIEKKNFLTKSSEIKIIAPQNIKATKNSLIFISPDNRQVSDEDRAILNEIEKFRENIFTYNQNKNIPVNKSPIRRKLSEKVIINVGLDFGTSTTKVAYRRGSKGKVTPLIFKHKLKNFENYFIPTVAAYDNGDNLLLGFEAAQYLEKNPEEQGLYDFKMLFASEVNEKFNTNRNIQRMKKDFGDYLKKKTLDTDSFKYSYLVVSFLIYCIRKIKELLIIEFPNRILDISINVCIPVDYVNDNKTLNVFKRLLVTAEFIEATHISQITNFKYISQVCRNIQYKEHLTKIFDIPETIAEVASYTLSPSVKNGLHVIIDFGAGTTDICIINICNPKNRNQKFNFYSALVIPFGFRKIDQLKNLKLERKIIPYLKEIWGKTHPAWDNAYTNHLRREDFWKGEKVQIYISGGGASQNAVKEIFSKPRINKEKWEEFKHTLSLLPTPEDYIDNDIPFFRLAVAYGLTNPKPNISLQDYILPKDAKNDTPVPKCKKIYNDDRIPNANWL